MNLFARFSMLATLLALLVILLGAYTRLKDAGLGCPDWPGCYGQMTVPKTSHELAQAHQRFPHQVIESKKAWLEMIHCYFAGTLGLFIFGLAVASFVRRRQHPHQTLIIPLLLSLLVIGQAALGMWTVTLSLLPWVVVGHLLGGILIVALLWTMTLSSRATVKCFQGGCRFKTAIALGALLVFLQIFLGGWVSANYAALICPDFPTCHGAWLTPLKWQEVFNLWAPIGVNYEGGILSAATRASIQMMHRYGALIVFLYMGALSLYVIIKYKALRFLGALCLFVLMLQVMLGTLNVLWMLPIPIAVAHNLVAVLLLLTVVTLFHRVSRKSHAIPAL